ncbi:MAG: ABC transporter ATP-binding protein [Bacteroidia bacterium]|nr:ABC transporter ATP-binding protein [Bacteroidia bacterium]
MNKALNKYEVKLTNLLGKQHATDVILPEDVILRAEHLCMFFGGVKAVNDLSFDVRKGEIFGLIGPNGAGKTTVFNCITQFYKPTSGQLYLRNRLGEIVNLNKLAVHNVILQGIVRTFQNLEVVKEVSVLDNLLIAAHRQYQSNFIEHMLHLPILTLEEKVIRARAEKVLNFMGLSQYRDWLVWGLPYGVLKKIEIARTLMANPHLIILDEPAAGLNDSETVELAALIRRIRDEYNCTILLVEHDMGLVMDVCDNILAISFGKKLAIGTAKEIQSNKDVQAAYLGAPEEDKK